MEEMIAPNHDSGHEDHEGTEGDDGLQPAYGILKHSGLDSRPRKKRKG